MLVLLVALVARVAFVLATPGYTPREDPGDYLRIGGDIARTGVYPVGHVWVTDRGCPSVPGLPRTPCVSGPGRPGAYRVSHPSAYRPPGYPYALAVPELIANWLGGSRLGFARGFQILIGVLDVGLIGLLGALVWGRAIALTAMGLAAVYLPLILASGTLISEVLYVALMLGALCAVLRWRERGGGGWLLAAGVLAGLSALTRANGVIVVVGAAALAASAPRDPASSRAALGRARAALLVALVAVVTIGGWTIRNAVVFGQLVPISTETGGTLVGTYNETSRTFAPQPAKWLGLAHIRGLHAFYREQRAHSEPTVDAALRRDAFTFIGDHPAYLATVLWHNTVRLLDLAGFSRVRFGAGTVQLPGPSAVAAAIMFYVVGLLALIGACLPAARRAPPALWIVPLLQFLTTVLVNTETPRFRTALEPFVVLLAALTLVRLGALASRAGGRRSART
jgi:4-amino-4-deoxy-L-arabinose transferase-like glycosyltransferase